MLFFDRWQEIFDTLRRNKLRTVLTGLSVAWGILMLILLLGAGEGLSNQVESNFKDDAANSVWIRPGRTSLPFQGIRPGRQLVFDNRDYEALGRVPGIEHRTGRFYLRGEFTVSRGAKSSSYDVRAVHPGHQFVEKTIIVRGRFINDRDVAEKRKIAIIGLPIAEFFFGDKDPIGEDLQVRGTNYRIAGVFTDEGAGRELQKIYLPITTAQLAYNGSQDIHNLIFTVGDADMETNEAILAQVRHQLSERLRFDPEDPSALRIRNDSKRYLQIQQIFSLIRAFLWIVGIGTLSASVIGVSNILLISVAERRVEIGVRKALGATPASIVWMIMKEALFVTGLAGYLGLLAGIGTLELANHYLPDNEYISNPAVGLDVALGALGFLILAGTLAGLMPAIRAARIHPTTALRGG